MESEPKIITFARRKKGDAAAQAIKAPPATLSAQSPSQVLTPAQGPGSKAANQTPADEGVKDTIPARWRRKGAANNKHKPNSEQQAFLAELKAHFEEVDAFELAVESPTPPPRHASSRIWKETGKPRPMSLGLSRRSSTLAPSRVSSRTLSMASPSPLRISMGTRFSLQPLLEDEIAEPGSAAFERRPSQPWNRRRNGSSISVSGATATGRRSSAATTRRSSAAQQSMLNRVSMGITDALQWLTQRGSLPGGIDDEGNDIIEEGEKEGEEQDGDADDQRAPAAEGDPEDAGIFTIAEEGEGSPSASESASPPAPIDAAHEVPSTGGKLSGDSLHEEFATKLALAEDVAPLSTPAAASPPFADLEPLQQLLKLCGQDTNIKALPSMEKLLGQHVDLTKVKKIGEGTFGEAFKAGGVVLKIVPMEGDVLVNGEPQKRSEEILAEVAITLTLSGLRDDERNASDENCGPNINNTAAVNSSSSASRCPNVTAGFVETYGVGICRGSYAAALKKEWHRWDKANGSENDPVDIFKGDQLFVVFVVADGGVDLEHFEPRSFDEIRSILMQVSMTLAVAEEACEFEHRDLHWGNLLISRDGVETIPYRLRDVDVNVHAAGVRVTLIDFTLSRLVTPEGDIAHCDLEADPEIFNGPKGDVQAETYRRMRKVTGKDWQAHVPATNTLWLHYLADIVLSHKMPAAAGREERGALRAFRKDAVGAEGATDLVWHDLFSGCWTATEAT